ncbi:MAG: hypothetical protein ACXVHL_36610 [Solirubrobacteraceae bacterium]
MLIRYFELSDVASDEPQMLLRQHEDGERVWLEYYNARSMGWIRAADGRAMATDHFALSEISAEWARALGQRLVVRARSSPEPANDQLSAQI